MNLDEIWRVYNEADCLADSGAIEAALDRLAHDITIAVGEANPLVFVVMNGAVIFSGQLLHRLRFPLETSYLHATRYGDRTRGELLEWRAKPASPVTGRNVLVLDDILDEGNTLDAITRHLEAAGAAQVLTAVLVHKSHDRKARPGMRADFTGLEVADRFLFGCGMDYKGYWRNAPGIYAVRGM